MAPATIADWLTGFSFVFISGELLYLSRKRSEFRACFLLKAFVVLLGLLTASMIGEGILGWKIVPDMNQLRTLLLAIFSMGMAVWLMETVRRIRTMPKLSELENMVRERTTALQAIIDNSPIAFVQIDTDGKVRVWNPAAEKIFGWRADDVIGQPLPIIPEFKMAEFKKNLDDTLANRSNTGMMTQRKHRDGHLVDVCFWNAPLRSGKERETLAMGMFADMTREVALTSSLALAKAEAERANEAKSRFLAYMSHEIRTPLSAIIGFGELLAANGLSPQQRKHFLETMVRNGQSLALLIDDILDMSKVEAGEMTTDPRPVSVREILEDVRTTLEVRAVSKGLTFEVSASDRIPGEVMVDSARLRQIILNVVNNAIKFTEKGGIFVKADHAAGFLKINVRDTGPGMNEEQQRRLFQPFNQTDKSVSAKYGGTGLGLCLSKQLTKLMGGHLLLKDSAPGRGSVFEIQVAAPEAPSDHTEILSVTHIPLKKDKSHVRLHI